MAALANLPPLYVEPPVLRDPDGAFSFENCSRNAALCKMGYQPPKTISTGTTIVAAIFKDGVVVGTDTRATGGNLIANKRCQKLAELTPQMFCAGAGTAADLDQVSRMLGANLRLEEMNTGRATRVAHAATMAKQYLFRYQGYIGAYLLIVGVDFTGPKIHGVHAHGSVYTLQYSADGSGSLAAMHVLETSWKKDMTREEGIRLVRDALLAGMVGDTSSGNSSDVSVITKDGAEMIREIDVLETPIAGSGKVYSYPKGTSTVVKQKILYETVDERVDEVQMDMT